jgi:hypothetical protein
LIYVEEIKIFTSVIIITPIMLDLVRINRMNIWNRETQVSTSTT